MDQTGPVRLLLDHDPHVNYAMQQNAVPVVKSVGVENRGDADLEDVRVRLSAEPDLAEPLVRYIDRLPAGGAHVLRDVDLRFSPARLVNQEERERGELRVEVTRGEEVLLREIFPLEVLAYGEWAGSASLPEILAAFVLPNHPVVERLLASARDRLERATGDPSLAGYSRRDPGRVRAIVEAVYAAACDLDLSYVHPPASFETTGQKIRTPDRILETRLGTCLDLAVLLAAALEQAGLHPLLVLVEGHAVAGVWLVDECFADATVDDPARIRKRVKLDEILLVDAVAMTTRPPLAFAEAVREGARHLEEPERFHLAVDVSAARKARIRPLALRAAVDGYRPVAMEGVVPAGERPAASPPGFPVDTAAPGGSSDAPPAGPPPDAAAAGASVEPLPPRGPADAAAAGDSVEAPAAAGPLDAPAADGPAGPPLAEEADTPASRLERWKRKLLDLSLRNRFLNHRDTKKTLPLLCPDVARLEDLLAGGRAFVLQPEPPVMGEDDPRDGELYRQRTGSDAREEFLRTALDDGRLHAALAPEELERRLVTIDREARLHLEEGGAGVLFLALGFLRWFESEGSAAERRAPILLLPVELARDVVKREFRLRLADDEPLPNVTLLQKLEVDFGIRVRGLDELKPDGSGVDVRAALDAVRRAVLDVPRWDVAEEVALGIFSFTKHVMWLDLEKRADRLLEHPVVGHLVERPDAEFEPGAVFPDPARLDAERDPAETFCPLDADSTQLAAVHAAADGRTFVLEGPPGTGKSQTITNLIAHSLATGKRVLFVSEKMAALAVVRRRLEQVGLGPFCLEIHSNQARKTAVLHQIEQALAFAGDGEVEDWAGRSAALRRLRTDLDEYVEVLHRPRSFGRSAFQGIAALCGLRDADLVPLDLGDADDVDAEALRRLRETTRQVRALLGEVGPPAGHPWRAARLEEWTPALPGRAEEAARRLADAARALVARAGDLAIAVGLPAEGHSRRSLEDLDSLGSLLESSPGPDGELAAEPGWSEVRKAVEGWTAALRRHATLDGALGTLYRGDLRTLPLDDLRARLEVARTTFWPLSWLRGRRARRTLRDALAGGKRPPDERLIGHLDWAIERRGLEARLAEAATEATRLLGRHWSGLRTDAGALPRLLDWTEGFRALLARVAGEDVDALLALRERWTRLAREARDLLRAGGALRRKLDGFREARAALDAALDAAAGLVDLDREVAFGGPEAPGFAEAALARSEAWASAGGRLRGWCAYRRARREAEEAGLAPLVEAAEDGRVDAERLPEALERSFHEWWVGRVFEAEPALRRFDGAERSHLVRRFARLDRELAGDTPAVVRGRLAGGLPRGTTDLSSQSESEMGVLQRELTKKRRHLAIRKLLLRIPNVISRLKPCLLMSPLSVAQYLTLDFPEFDLVVFDEASQIPVWDAIGAIRRGRKLVVVGDSKQLPPTSFFQRVDDEEVDEDDIEEMESVLDECVAARLPRMHLGWHYRSRHESLIAFSNARYYGGGLLTFPSPVRDPEQMGLSWHLLPDAVYERGRARTNRAEAEAVVAEIVRRLTDPALGERSLGVVTFSLPQQTLIEDLLDRARSERPEIDRHFGSEVDEPVFVKNLENVQGDERDVILFSVCYGPDREGRVALNFGPLNRAGGERRLNVAITRARRQVLLFTSVRADQIDLARTASVGVRHLREYLEYAEKGEAALAQALRLDPEAAAESPFEEEVRRALVERGHEVRPQVGCSGYRIDLGVVDPDRPGRFLLGIECDGAMYHRARTARDRDRLRQSVLEGLGWRLHRIWSTDWWQDPALETEKVLAAIEAARAADGPAAAGGEPAAVEAASEEPPAAEDAPPGGGSPAAQDSPPGEGPPPDTGAGGAVSYAREPARPGGAPPAPSARRPYATTPFLGVLGDAESFLRPEAVPGIQRVLGQVLAHEAPVSRTVLARRIAAHWGHDRLTRRVLDRILEALPSRGLRQTASRWETFVWREDQDPAAYDVFRVTGEGEEERRPEDIPPEETAVAALEILRGHVSMSRVDLARETGRAFGYQRLGAKLSACMEAGMLLLAERGAVRLEGEVVSLT